MQHWPMRLVLAGFLLLAAAPVLAQDGWEYYENARFGYAVEIPPGYVGEGESDNGDGQIFTSADGTQTLRVHGENLPDGDFEAEVGNAMDLAREAGWDLSYERTTPSWASFSGTNNGMILYARAIDLCDGDALASFELYYPERDLDDMHEVVERLVASFEDTGDGLSC